MSDEARQQQLLRDIQYYAQMANAPGLSPLEQAEQARAMMNMNRSFFGLPAPSPEPPAEPKFVPKTWKRPLA